MDLLKSLSAELSGIVESASPWVVRVDARRRLPGSGIVWSAEGLILTAEHVVEHDEQIRVGLADGRTLAASLVGRDPTTDIAVLRAEAGGLIAASWSDPEPARVGHMVVALGRPGRTVRARLGIVSAAADRWRAPGGAEIERYLEVDTGPVPGFSGGPVLDASGGVLGMNTAGLLRRTSLVLPAPTVRRIAQTLVAQGRIPRGYLGIGGQPVRLPASLREKLGQEMGLLLVSVETGSPAERAGLLLGDVILGFGAASIHHHQDLMGLLTADRIGASLPARILRGGSVLEVGVVVGERA